MEPLISVIVPIYNVEKYLCQCVDSILGQTYQNLEVILVDDGSPDNCAKLCDDYAVSDSRIKVIHKENGGLSDARNAGLKVATGEYVVFVDSDDYWSGPEVLDHVIKEMGANDFINFNWSYFYQNSNLFERWAAYPEEVIFAEDKKKKVIELIRHGIFPVSACMKLIRRQFLSENNIWFIKGLVGEDIPWFLELITKSRNFKFINEYVYIYRKQVTGTLSSSFNPGKYRDLLTIVDKETKNIRENITDSDLKNALLSFIAYEYCILMGMVNHFPVTERKQQIKELKEFKWLLNYDLNPKVKKVKILLRFTGRYLTSWVLFYYIRKIVNRN